MQTGEVHMGTTTTNTGEMLIMPTGDRHQIISQDSATLVVNTDILLDFVHSGDYNLITDQILTSLWFVTIVEDRITRQGIVQRHALMQPNRMIMMRMTILEPLERLT